jgi:methylmalonyl-CoA/ethylmalonyl-CoA epimerase
MVRDLDAAIERWRRVLGVLDPRQLEQPIVRYDHFSGGGDDVAMAIFVSPHGAEIQLLSPLNDGPTARLLARRGEGVHHITFTHSRVDEAARELRAAGLRLTSEEPMVDPGIPWLDFTFIAPDSANGTMIEICSPYEPVDGRWQPAQAAGASG